MIVRLFPLLAFLIASTAPASPDAGPFPTPPGIKGLQVQMEDDAIALGIHHAGINVNLTALLDLERKPDNPKRAVGGRTFSFHAGYLRALDGQVKPLSDKRIVCYAILLAYPSKDAAREGITIHPGSRERKKRVRTKHMTDCSASSKFDAGLDCG
ncbi:MAG: DUF5722 domain-containing protein [Verrucomicrobiales bacterium]